MTMRQGKEMERVLAKINGRISIVDGCWVWQGSRTRNGYGHVRWPGSRLVLVHRAMWHVLVDPRFPLHRDSGGLEIDHLCHVRACCNPDHLEPVSGAENMRRAWARRRAATA